MKKGLVNNVAGVIIAIIGLVIIAGSAYKIYGLVATSDTESAQHALDLIDARIKAVESGKSVTFALRGPSGWALVGWNVAEEARPEKCFFTNCICACPDSTSMSKSSKTVISHDYLATLSNSCQEKGICRAYEPSVSVGSNILITRTGYSNTLSGEAKPARFGELNEPLFLRKITFPKNLLEIEVESSESGVSVHMQDDTQNKYELFNGAL